MLLPTLALMAGCGSVRESTGPVAPIASETRYAHVQAHQLFMNAMQVVVQRTAQKGEALLLMTDSPDLRDAVMDWRIRPYALLFRLAVMRMQRWSVSISQFCCGSKNYFCKAMLPLRHLVPATTAAGIWCRNA